MSRSVTLTNNWFSDPCLYGAVLLQHSRDQSSSQASGKLLTGPSPGKTLTSQHLHHIVHRPFEGRQLLLGYLPSEVQKTFSRGKELLGESHPGTDHYPKGSSGDYKPSLLALRPYQGGVIEAEIMTPPDK